MEIPNLLLADGPSVCSQQFCYMDQQLPTSLIAEILNYLQVSFQNGNVKFTFHSKMIFQNNKKSQFWIILCKHSAGRLLTLTPLVQLCIDNYY